jgi:hypothetical protein
MLFSADDVVAPAVLMKPNPNVANYFYDYLRIIDVEWEEASDGEPLDLTKFSAETRVRI